MSSLIDRIPPDALFLGLDVGTQTLKGTVLNRQLQVVCEAAVVYDTELSQYGTKGGVKVYTTGDENNNNKNHSTNNVVRVPPLMWVQALEMMLDKMKNDSNLDFAKIVSISGSAQQHGSVYWRPGASQALLELNNNNGSISSKLGSSFEYPITKHLAPYLDIESPIWMDSSTREQCKELERRVGGPANLAKITGSRAYERFTGNQIAKFFQNNRPTDCERISLVSSFAACFFAGKYVPIDVSDGSGMNLMSIESLQWDSSVLRAVEEMIEAANNKLSDESTTTTLDLRSKLGEEPVESRRVVGHVNKFLCSKYGFKEDCLIVAFSGDNPNSACFTLRDSGDVSISLGTSSVCMGFVDEASPNPDEGHVFVSPLMRRRIANDDDGPTTSKTNAAAYLPLVCFKNGAMIREEFRDRFTQNKTWQEFDAALGRTTAGNNGCLGFFYQYPEITPPTAEPGYFRFEPTTTAAAETNNTTPAAATTDTSAINGYKEVEKFSGGDDAEIRALVEHQFLAMRLHAERMNMRNPKRIIATGGASLNKEILRVMSDVFGCAVYTSKQHNSAPVGAACRAMHGFLEERSNINAADGASPSAAVVDYFALVSSLLEPFECVCTPNQENTRVYDALMPRFEALEREIVVSRLNPKQ